MGLYLFEIRITSVKELNSANRFKQISSFCNPILGPRVYTIRANISTSYATAKDTISYRLVRQILFDNLKNKSF